MKTRKTKLMTFVILIALLLVGLIVFAGCKKKSEPVAPEQAKEITADTEQTICPVMKAPINKNISTEYKGKKVYFCCAGCKEKFEKEPEKYIAELPQFKK